MVVFTCLVAGITGVALHIFSLIEGSEDDFEDDEADAKDGSRLALDPLLKEVETEVNDRHDDSVFGE